MLMCCLSELTGQKGQVNSSTAALATTLWTTNSRPVPIQNRGHLLKGPLIESESVFLNAVYSSIGAASKIDLESKPA
jgi:hypothetical protein